MEIKVSISTRGARLIFIFLTSRTQIDRTLLSYCSRLSSTLFKVRDPTTCSICSSIISCLDAYFSGRRLQITLVEYEFFTIFSVDHEYWTMTYNSCALSTGHIHPILWTYHRMMVCGRGGTCLRYPWVESYKRRTRGTIYAESVTHLHLHLHHCTTVPQQIIHHVSNCILRSQIIWYISTNVGKYDHGYWSGPYIFWYKRVTMDTKFEFDYAQMVKNTSTYLQLDQYQKHISKKFTIILWFWLPMRQEGNT